MTQGPDQPDQPQQPDPQQPPAYGQQPPAYGQQPPAYGGYGTPGAWGAGPDAPYGRDPKTGLPYSDKQKLIAGVLQILLPIGVGRFYIGDTGIGVAQLLVTVLTCGIGSLWAVVDGVLILVGDKKDARGLPLRP